MILTHPDANGADDLFPADHTPVSTERSLVGLVIDEVRRAFAATAIAERDHHHPDAAHALYPDDKDTSG